MKKKTINNILESAAMSDLSSCQRYSAEGIFFLFKIADSILEPTLRLYIYHLTAETYRGQSEEKTQSAAAIFLMTYKVAVNLPAILVSLFCGAWSDRVGRKLPVMLCCFGSILACLLYMASLMTSPLLGMALVLTGALLRGCFGKSAVITMALHSYIADVSTTQERTQSLGRLLSMNYFGYCVGSLVGGALLENAAEKYSGPFCTSILLNTCCVFIAIICMAESIPVKNLKNDNELTGSILDTKMTSQEDSVQTLEQPFQLSNIKSSLNVLHRPRLGNLRCQLITLFAMIVLVQLCKSGEIDVMLLFVERSPLSWSESTYSYLLAVDYAAMGVVQLLLLPLFTRCADCADTTLVLIGLLFKSARLLMLTLSVETWQVFAAVVTGCPLSLIISGIKSMISKTVSEDEIGKTFSTLSCGELMANLFGSIVFNNVYAATSYTLFPGFAFLADLVVHLCMMFIIFALIARNDACCKRVDQDEKHKYEELQ